VHLSQGSFKKNPAIANNNIRHCAIKLRDEEDKIIGSKK